MSSAEAPEPHAADLPADLSEALAADAEAAARFAALPPSHRREYVAWIEEAKREDTRRRRIERTLVRVRDAGAATRV